MPSSITIETFVSPPLDTNVYLVADPGQGVALAVDPACAAAAVLEKCAREGWRLETIVLTHGHIDHTHDTARLARETGAAIVCHPGAAPWLGDPMLCGAQWLGMTLEPCQPARTVDEGDEIALGDHAFTVLHAPGHSPGCVCLLNTKHCFTGDVIFRDGIGRSDLPGGDARTLQASLKRLTKAIPTDTTLYPGHGPSTTMARELGANPFLRF